MRSATERRGKLSLRARDYDFQAVLGELQGSQSLENHCCSSAILVVIDDGFKALLFQSLQSMFLIRAGFDVDCEFLKTTSQELDCGTVAGEDQRAQWHDQSRL